MRVKQNFVRIFHTHELVGQAARFSAFGVYTPNLNPLSRYSTSQKYIYVIYDPRTRLEPSAFLKKLRKMSTVAFYIFTLWLAQMNTSCLVLVVVLARQTVMALARKQTYERSSLNKLLTYKRFRSQKPGVLFKTLTRVRNLAIFDKNLLVTQL